MLGELKKFKPNTVKILFASLAFVFALCSVLISNVFTVLAAPLLAAFLLLNDKKGRWISFAVSAAYMIFALVLSPIAFVSAAFLVLYAFVMHFSFNKIKFKYEAGAILTALVMFSFVCTAVAVALDDGVAFSVSGITAYYASLFDELKAAFVKSLAEAAESYGGAGSPYRDMLSESNVNTLINNAVMFSPALIFGFAFVIAGLIYRVFDRLILFFTDGQEKICRWRFLLPKTYGYAFILLMIFGLFAKSESVFGYSLQNLTMIFTFAFAYVGYQVVAATMRRRRLIPAFPVFVLSVVFLGYLPVVLCSVVGLWFTLKQDLSLDGPTANA